MSAQNQQLWSFPVALDRRNLLIAIFWRSVKLGVCFGSCSAVGLCAITIIWVPVFFFVLIFGAVSGFIFGLTNGLVLSTLASKTLFGSGRRRFSLYAVPITLFTTAALTLLMDCWLETFFSLAVIMPIALGCSYFATSAIKTWVDSSLTAVELDYAI